MTKMLHIVSRDTAKHLGMIRYFTGKTCRNGHIDERLVSNKICLGCARKNNKVHYQRALKDQRSTAAGRERGIANDRRYHDRNKERINAVRRDRYAENVEIKRAQKRAWSAKNKESVLANQRKMKFQRLKRAPGWLTADDWAQMEAFYERSRAITAETGVVHHVDHMVPLVGKKVSGLHVPWNLQVIPASDNLKKGNRIIES